MAATTGQTTVGLTAVQLKNTTIPFTCGVQVIPLQANSGKIYLGFASGVTTSTGVEVPATGLFVPAWLMGDAVGIYLISDASDQGVSYMGA